MSFVVKIRELPTPWPRKKTDERSSLSMQTYIGKSGNKWICWKIVFHSYPKIENMVQSLNNDTRAIYQLANIKEY